MRWLADSRAIMRVFVSLKTGSLSQRGYNWLQHWHKDENPFTSLFFWSPSKSCVHLLEQFISSSWLLQRKHTQHGIDSNTAVSASWQDQVCTREYKSAIAHKVSCAPQILSSDKAVLGSANRQGTIRDILNLKCRMQEVGEYKLNSYQRAIGLPKQRLQIGKARINSFKCYHCYIPATPGKSRSQATAGDKG